MKMVTGFKDYSKRGVGLAMSAEELIKVNTCLVGKFYDDTTPMLSLLESPGLRIIDPTKAGDGSMMRRPGLSSKGRIGVVSS